MRLSSELGHQYNKSTLFKMRKLYLSFRNEKVAPLVPQLTWSHCLLLIPLEDKAIIYYAYQVIYRNLSKRQLADAIKNKEYERLPEETKNDLVIRNDSKINDYIKNPIIIKDNIGFDVVTEKVLQRLILEDISSFMKELGEGFCFIDNEYKIKISDRYNYIDLLFYNIQFNCYVVVELKITELRKEHIGQIEAYMNYIDKNLKRIDQDRTIGIIIVKKDNCFIMEYCSDSRILRTTYEVV